MKRTKTRTGAMYPQCVLFIASYESVFVGGRSPHRENGYSFSCGERGTRDEGLVT